MIGVFDSGYGGLTILRALIDCLPDQRFAYLGDHGNAPYGDRGDDEIYALTVANVERLFNLGCSLVILACNTAAAVALRRLQQTWLPNHYPARRVLGVLVPVVEGVTDTPWHMRQPRHAGRSNSQTMGIFATQRTVDSGAYIREIQIRAPSISIVQQACPALARAIEAGLDGETVADLVDGYVDALLSKTSNGPPERVILGCTHYPLVEEAFRKALPPSVDILDQPKLVAESLADYLHRHPEHGDRAALGKSGVVAFSTAEAPRIRALGRRFFGHDLSFCRIGPLPMNDSRGAALRTA